MEYVAMALCVVIGFVLGAIYTRENVSRATKLVDEANEKLNATLAAWDKTNAYWRERERKD